MKNLRLVFKFLFALAFFFLFTSPVNGQILKKLAKKAEKAAERTVERRVEQEASKKTDQALDSILEPGSKGKENKNPIPQPSENPNNTGQGNPNSSPSGNPTDTSNSSGSTTEPKTMIVYSKFDFVPGDKLLFFDDYSSDFIGDFPAKWNTNGSGEVVTVGDSPTRWMQVLPGHSTYYVPDVPNLPDDYTIEFDILALGIDKKTSSTADMSIILSENELFKKGKHYVSAEIPFCQYSPIGIRMKNFVNNKTGSVNNVVDADLREVMLNRPHISIAVNQKRFRLWVNEKKYIDIPRLIETPDPLTTLKFALSPTFDDGKEKVFIANLKVAEGGVDLRRKLLSEGKVSTNGILFDTGSANIQPQSMGIIRQISQVLQQDASINLNIIGHTDADGGIESNMALSKKRAEAVRKALISIYNAAPERLTAEGMGESQPVGDNNTPNGKAQNRRVEFVKQ